MRSALELRLSAVPALAVASALALAAAACQSSPPQALTEADRTAIQETTSAALDIANGSRDWNAYVDTYYAPDAIFMPPNQEEIQGRTDIAIWFDSFPSFTDLQFNVQHLEGSGDIAYVQGTYSMMMTPPGGEQTEHEQGKYLEVWRRQMDGTWQVAFDIFNSDQPTQGMSMSGEGGGGGGARP